MKTTNWTPSAVQAYILKHGSFPPGADKAQAITIKQGRVNLGRYSIVSPR